MASSKVMASTSPTNPDLPRQSSIHSLTVADLQCDQSKSFGSMNMDELLKNIYGDSEGFPSSAVNGGDTASLSRQASLTLPAAAAYAYALPIRVHPNVHKSDINQQQHQHRGRPSSTTSTTFTTSATKTGGFFVNSIIKRCQTCGGQGAVECSGCKGTGKNKKNGNIFERWKCFDCQGFGLKSCPSCGKGGLTPEQRGER